jgi:hypothetical protein
MSDMFLRSIQMTTIELPLSAKFEPETDITAYELAKLLPYLMGEPLYRKKWEEMPPEVQRHLTIVP